MISTAPDDNDWREIDFRPAPPGWTIAGLVSTEGGPQFRISPFLGWLVYEHKTDPDRDRRLVPAANDPRFAGLYPARSSLDDGWFYGLYGPGESIMLDPHELLNWFHAAAAPEPVA